MQTKITETTGAYGLGLPPGRKLLRITSGQYAGRLLAVLQTSAGDIKYSYADQPYTSWSELVAVAVDAVDAPFDCAMDDSGNVFVVYSETTSNRLVVRKLTFAGGIWNVGSKITVYDGDPSLYPSLAAESTGRLWVSWTRISAGLHYIQAKSSTDSGATWGAGTSDPGDTLTGGASSAYAKILVGLNDVFVVYADGGLKLSLRSLPVDGGTWTAPYDLAAGTQFDQHFDAAASADGLLGVVFDRGSLQYREFNGEIWSAAVTLDPDGGDYPQLFFDGTLPAIVYLSSLAADQLLVKYTIRATGSFSEPAVLDARAKTFDAVTAYDASSATYADLTDAAASATPGDVVHPQSGFLVENSGDSIYLGMDRKFRYVKFRMSTAGSGGCVVYSYWDGSNWIAFTPAGGSFALDAPDRDLLLWEDYHSMPDDWQKKTIDGRPYFWVKIEVHTSFSIGAIGSQLTAASDLKALVIER